MAWIFRSSSRFSGHDQRCTVALHEYGQGRRAFDLSAGFSPFLAQRTWWKCSAGVSGTFRASGGRRPRRTQLIWLFASWWDLARDALAAEKHGMQSPALTHACEYETSLMMALRGDLVRLRARPGGRGGARQSLDAFRTRRRRARVPSISSLYGGREHGSAEGCQTAEKGSSILRGRGRRSGRYAGGFFQMAGSARNWAEVGI